MADSSNTSSLTPGDEETAGEHWIDSRSALSVSRRVKIGIVLALMLSGYFLIDDRPYLGTIGGSEPVQSETDVQMQQFMEELDFVDAGQAQGRPAHQVKVEPQPPPATLPVQVDGFPQLPVDPHEVVVLAEFDDQPTEQIQSHSMTRPPQATTTPMAAARPRLRFTGHIEPLR